MELIEISRALAREIDALRFAPPVSAVYNPLIYASRPHEEYLRRYGAGPKEVLLLGMNPGPFGMAQTGVPFGDTVMVREWLGISEPVGKPPVEHPKRPIDGFACRKREVSGTRLWGWARARWETPERFFAHAFVMNYCPLLFMEASGKNLTPDKLFARERAAIYAPCDTALRRTVDLLQPRIAIGVGNFAAQRLQEVLADYKLTIASIPHPSPANPQANAGWADAVNARLRELGIMQE